MNSSIWWVGALAIFGSLTGPLGLLISILNYRRDRGSLAVRFVRGLRSVNTAERYEKFKAMRDSIPENIQKLMAEHLAALEKDMVKLDPSKSWAYITVINNGRRPIKMDKAGLLLGRDGGSYMAWEGQPKLLTEGDSTDILIDDDALIEMEEKNKTGQRFNTAFVLDVLGREYYSPLPLRLKLYRTFGHTPLRMSQRAIGKSS